tara:strand:- start:1640 stop:4156 length:2517 start_codon:yes stop_codon:yes gene_type:complete
MKLINIFVLLLLSSALSYSQVTATQPSNLETCDEVPFDGFAEFDLETQTPIILDAQDPANFEVTYHEDEDDANNGVNAIISPYSNLVNPEVIYARVTEMSTGEYATTNFTIIVIDCSQVTATQPPNLETCDEVPFDGLAVFDLEIQTPIILGAQDPANFEVTYHQSQIEANNGESAIISPYSNLVNPEEIYARVTEITTGEYATTNFIITVIDCSGNFYPSSNGVTCMCPDASLGDTGVVNGITYTKRTREQITIENAATTCTSGITDMYWLFRGQNTFNEDISSWDVSNVTNMEGMFDCYDSGGNFIFNQDLSYWDTSNVHNMSFMFRDCYVFNSDLSNWDTGNVSSMWSMFEFASDFNSDISLWDVSNAQNMSSMFLGADSFNQSIGNWDVSSTTDMQFMFWGWDTTTNFDQDLSDWEFNPTVSLSRFLDLSGMSTENYDLLLESFNNQSLGGRLIGVEGLIFCNETARDALILDGWLFEGDSALEVIFSAPQDLIIEPDNGLCVATGVVLGQPIIQACETITISNDMPTELPLGITTVTWTLVDGNGTTLTDTQQVEVIMISDEADLCYVTADILEPTKNRIFITSDPELNGQNVDSHEVLRENSSGIFESIGFIVPPEISFLDVTSDNNAQANRYKVQTIDICGQHLTLSDYHKTMLLQSSIATDNSVNLTWNPYIGTPFNTYYIFRSVNGSNYELLASIASTNTSYNDTSANVVDNFYEYYVSIDVTSCSTIPLQSFALRSNLEYVNPNLLVPDIILLDRMVWLYPIPAEEYLNILLKNGIELESIEFFSTSGQSIMKTNENHQINISKLKPGVYYLNINTNQGVVTKTIVRY